MRRGLVLWGALWLSAALGAACGGAGDTHQSGSGGSSGLVHPPSSPASIPGHSGRMRSKCSACHTPEDRQNPRWKEVVGSMGHDLKENLEERTTCQCCHLGEVKGFGEPFEARCLDCHDELRVTIPKMGSQHCVSCHKLGTEPGDDIRLAAWECQKCHAEAQGASAAIDVHGGEDCSNCHSPHEEPWAIQRECTECHEAQDDVHHGKIGERETPICTDCHSPHEKAGAASEKCADCHKEKNPDIVANARFPGHDACTSCHAPHDFGKEGAMECGACHKARTMSGRGEKEHATCENCHSPHNVKGSLKDACTKCHQGVASSHPDPKGQGCTTCHSPHPGASASGVATVLASAGCASCHSNARTQAGEHGDLSCGKCHETHKEGQKPQTTCKDCHSAQLARTALQPKHGDCLGCHTGSAHRPQSNIGACVACHADQQKSAPKGHSDCAKCHDTHSGKSLQPAGAAGCKACHADRSASASAAKHTDCAGCHRAHGPGGVASPPACTTCHAQSKLAALHGEPGHQTCGSCHPSAHGGAKSDRATCTTCHANEKEHQPDAPVCSGCHRFTNN